MENWKPETKAVFNEYLDDKTLTALKKLLELRKLMC